MMQSPDDVEFSRSLVLSLGSPLEDLLIRHDVTFGTLQIGPEGAKRAAIDAHVSRVEMLVDIVLGEIGVLAFAHEIS